MITEIRIDEDVYLGCYRHLLDNDADIHFLWGGRDSGKSHFIAQRLIEKCLSEKYFRCILVKSTANSIKDSQWETIKSVVEDWGLESLFTFTKSPLEITCVNGNRFIARGCDEAAKLKSIKDPSDTWIEEANLITEDDFNVITTTLRANAAKIQQWISFNPECKGDYRKFWIYERYIKEHYEKGIYNFTSTTHLKNPLTGKDVPLTYTSTHTTYRHNPFVTDQRIAFLESQRKYYYQVFTLGMWGNREIKDPFAFNFDYDTHVGKVERTRGQTLIASFDFNRNPITCFIGQILPGNKVRGIEQIKLANSDIYKLCDYILLHYPNALWMVTGDATGANSSALVQDNINYYTVIRNKLRLTPAQLKVPNINPKIEENQQLVNAVLRMLDCKFDENNCEGLIFDFQNVEMLPTGQIDKSNRNDPTMQADALDCFRYFCNTFLPFVLKMI